jgi:ribose 1,5-bisphosphokinase
MRYARKSGIPCLFAHRYITRPPEEGGENHIYLTEEEFHTRKEKGLFALAWESHGLSYGIGREIDTWLENGCDVIVNGSRAYLPEALQRYPDLVTIRIEADPEVIRQRLENRGRETARDIEKRIQRAPSVPPSTPNLISIRNDGLLEEGGEALIAAIATYTAH